MMRARMPTEAVLLVAAIAVPLTLFWDFSWESTIGVDAFFGPPHAANYAAVALAAAAALRIVALATQSGVGGVALGRVRAPLGAWIVLWGGLAFVTALLFDRWWQASYGLAAGIWHPPQIAKALAYFAVVAGAWLTLLAHQDTPSRARRAALAGGALLAMISVVTTAQSFANRQHSELFYLLACASYPLVLTAQSAAGRMRAPATLAALGYLAFVGSMVWLLPRFAATPQAGPVYNALDHLLPPPFPLLLVVPAVALDGLLHGIPSRAGSTGGWASALECGCAFFALFAVTQWLFSAFLLSPVADDWLFAGGGRHWPFFLRIDPTARTAYWGFMSPDLGLVSGAVAVLVAIVAARAGLWLGALREVRA